jgi:hypothetical protein
LAVDPLKERSKVLFFWIKVMEHLRLLQNYASTLAVVAGMTGTPINRLKRTWAGVPQEAEDYFQDCRNLMDKNFARLRLELGTATPPAIPYLGAYQRDLVYLDESPTMKGTEVNVTKLSSIANVISNCLAFQHSNYWFEDIIQIQNVITFMPTFSEEESHALSLKLEPRAATIAPEPTGHSRKKSTSGSITASDSGSIPGARKTVVNKFASMADEDLPRLPTFPPPLTDKEEYKEYMQLRYEYKKRKIPLDGAAGFGNVSKVDEGGGFMKISNKLEDGTVVAPDPLSRSSSNVSGGDLLEMSQSDMPEDSSQEEDEGEEGAEAADLTKSQVPVISVVPVEEEGDKGGESSTPTQHRRSRSGNAVPPEMPPLPELTVSGGGGGTGESTSPKPSPRKIPLSSRRASLAKEKRESRQKLKDSSDGESAKKKEEGQQEEGKKVDEASDLNPDPTSPKGGKRSSWKPAVSPRNSLNLGQASNSPMMSRSSPRSSPRTSPRASPRNSPLLSKKRDSGTQESKEGEEVAAIKSKALPVPPN